MLEDKVSTFRDNLFDASWDIWPARFRQAGAGEPTEALFWHGTNWMSVLKILDAGMQVVATAAGGSMFGRGIYMSDAIGKAVEYSRRVPLVGVFGDLSVGSLIFNRLVFMQSGSGLM